MKRLKINPATGSVVVLPNAALTPRLVDGELIREATPVDLEALSQPGCSRWVSDDINAPTGPGQVVKATEGIKRLLDSIDKLTLKRNLEALGKWETFKAAMSQMPGSVQEDFNLAATLQKTDPTFAEYAPQLKQVVGLTDEQFSDLFSA